MLTIIDAILEGTANHEAIIRPVNASSNTVGIDTSVKREFYRCGVDNTDNISTSRGLNNSKEWAVKTIFCVKFYNLLVVIGTLQEFDSSIQGTAIGLEDDSNGV
eukprot:CAMPEP_0201865922 /NCGR_PEP_ID=MMETSP0902-20130614/680_1 /ASSEMBLY_ACC=CAM_ASM_000551 /TAXON_ID=420261 /ORGANISM="Thalassiosira antarctica, Strain CCMP982" /LENGTH=103 /DNA_ID=CAMNT_0048390791 /DNA_START=258 /DNA_END=565 /DNA_ORIENTATION=-